MTTIDEVKTRLDLVETVRGYVPALKRSGRLWKAPCPFHSEKTPSFIVDPERGTWHCFGACSTGGDVIEFVRRAERLEFREALRLCAERAGVELRPPTAREQREREAHERLLSANEAAAVFYQAALRGPDGASALAYARGRGLDDETLSMWQIGYAPDGWSALTDHLLARGFAEVDLIEAGLSVRGPAERKDGLYDRFRDRLMFPTRDQRGRLVGFGARALKPEQEPKYLNTPQTPLFDKGGVLFGLDRAAESARRADRLIVVEGYMDVIGCHQAGIRNVVASQGTSITERQMAIAQRLTHNLVLALDADNAGSEATLRGIEVAAGAADRGSVPTLDWRGLVSFQDVLHADIRVAALPAGEDPDSLARGEPERLRELLEAAQPVAEHVFSAVTAATDLDNPRARSRALELLTPTVAGTTDPVVRAHYVQRLARLGRVDERTVLALLARGRNPQRPAPVPSRTEVARAARGAPAVADGEAQLLQLLLQRPECRAAGLALDEETFEDALNRRLFEAWREQGPLDPAAQEADAAEWDDEVRDRYVAFMAAELPEYEAKYLDERVRDIARMLRLRRAQARLLPAALDQASEVAAARRAGAPVGELAAVAAGRPSAPGPAIADGDAGETAALAADFVMMDVRQRALSRRYRGLETHEDEDAPSKEAPGMDGAGHERERRELARRSADQAMDADVDDEWEDFDDTDF